MGLDVGITIINILLLSMLFVIGVAIARMRSLFAIVMLSGVYSLVSATWFVAMDAVDVAFTEAAVGAGISTALMLGAMLLTVRTAKSDRGLKNLAPLVVVVATGAMLIYASIDLPALGDPNAPANAYAGAIYLQDNMGDTGIQNVVTSVLASYRGFDTLGETAVVFTAGLAVVMLLGFGERSLTSKGSNKKTDEGPKA